MGRVLALGGYSSCGGAIASRSLSFLRMANLTSGIIAEVVIQ
ncbi:hypothetical protein [Acaryochloris marina]|uniref:Uncharacterized protein n=1 Tax=Acaryochloris marina (strain MBIC 11017) TaxID=329726 RepID=B0CFV0_ACAM1|nr:hypothetical protein [Acaryochloris marina]ABW28254.1 hypothetical protein AM1_3258 [Acaryochloris marina MBIC11017]